MAEYVLWSLAHRAWWRPGGWGYADTLRDAGVFDDSNAEHRAWLARADEGALQSVAIPLSALAGAALNVAVREEEARRRG